MTVREGAAALKNAGIPAESAMHEAMLLAEYTENISRTKLLLLRDETFGPGFDEAVARRCQREPLQYIIGTWSFMGLDFKVAPGCLIPRPETELIAQRCAALLPHGGCFADLCTGSGCIAVSVLTERPDVTGAAVDISEAALRIAQENAALHGVSDRLAILQGDISEKIFSDEKTFSVIVSNPPYIPSADVLTLEPELAFEPQNALDGGDDGLDLVKILIEHWLCRIEKGGAMLIEYGIGQTEAIAAMAQCAIDRGEAASYRIHRDYAGIERAIEITV